MHPSELAELRVTLRLTSAGPASVQGLPHPPLHAAPASLAGVQEYGDPPYQLHMHIQGEDGWSVRFRWDGRKLHIYASGMIDQTVGRRHLRTFRQSLSVYDRCVICLTAPRTRVNYPCMCFCCCDGCAHHHCYMCGREVVDTLAVRFL